MEDCLGCNIVAFYPSNHVGFGVILDGDLRDEVLKALKVRERWLRSVMDLPIVSDDDRERYDEAVRRLRLHDRIREALSS